MEEQLAQMVESKLINYQVWISDLSYTEDLLIDETSREAIV